MSFFKKTVSVYFGYPYKIYNGVRLVHYPRVCPVNKISYFLADQLLELRNIDSKFILLIGEGTGYVSIKLALNTSKTVIWATDISESAIACMKDNFILNEVSDRIYLNKYDLLKSIPLSPPPDLIAFNPPQLPDFDGFSTRQNPEEFNINFTEGDGLQVVDRLLKEIRQNNWSTTHILLGTISVLGDYRFTRLFDENGFYILHKTSQKHPVYRNTIIFNHLKFFFQNGGKFYFSEQDITPVPTWRKLKQKKDLVAKKAGTLFYNMTVFTLAMNNDY